MFRSATSARVVLIVSLVTGVTGSTVTPARPGRATSPPEPPPACLPVLMPSGDADWYCGEVIRIPPGSRVIEHGLTPCVNEDGSDGPLPCRWDARMRGGRRGSSFTILPDGDPMGGMRRVLYRYDDGITVRATMTP